MDVSVERPPHRILTPRLVLRSWTADDVLLLREAVDGSLEHLRAWMPWAMQEPSSQEDTATRLRRYAAQFDAGEDFTFGVFSSDESQVLGACGLHPRVGEAALEIGYWIRVDQIRQGFATEASRALTSAAFTMGTIKCVQIHCDPANRASARVPEKLGYLLVERRRNDKKTPNGEPRDTLVFEMTRQRWGSSS